MTTPVQTSAAVQTRGVFARRSIVVVLAIGQIVSNIAFDLWSPTELQSGVRFSPLVPPGPMFAIWAPIIAASVLWAILQIRPSVRTSPLRDQLVAPLCCVYAGFALWLAAAAPGQSSPLTLVVFVFIVAAHFVAWRCITAARAEIATWKRVDRVVLYVSQGLYAGWTSMAFFVNIATVLQASGAAIDGVWGTTWQLLVIAAAAGTAVAFVVATAGSSWYVAAACYALIGAGISSALGGFAALTIALWLAAAAGTAVAFVVATAGSSWYVAAACYALIGAGISSALGGFAALTIALAVGVVLVVGSTVAVRGKKRLTPWASAPR